MSRRTTSRITVAVAAVISFAVQASALTDANQFNAQSLNQGRPLFFTENKGQWDERVLFKADGAGGLTWFIERDGFTVLFSSSPTSIEGGDKGGVGSESFVFTHDPLARFDPRKSNPPSVPPFNRSGEGGRAHALKFKFLHALPRTAGSFLPEQTSSATAASIEASDRLSWNNNYFLGNDESKWAPDCGNYQRVVLKDVWPGVDVVWRGEDSQRIKQIERIEPGSESASSVSSAVNMIEFDFVVAPGADASQIRVECFGLTGDLSFNTENTGGTESTELSLGTSLGTLRMALPEAYQIEPDGSLQEVRAEFKVEGGNSFGVALPEGHDPTKPLVVDPLVYSTYLGGSGGDVAYAISPDGEGGVVVAGYTQSDDFPVTEGAFDGTYYGGDVFVTHLSGNGDELLYSTYLGGASQAYALTPDGAGGMIVAGWTGINDFPTTEEAFDRSFNGERDVFVTRLNGSGSELIYSTFLGGGNEDFAYALTLDRAGGVVIAGLTYSNDFPTNEGAYDRSLSGVNDAFVAKLSEDGSQLLYGMYLGGGSSEEALALEPDTVGGVIVAGFVGGDGFPTTEGTFDLSFNGGSDAFIARLSEDGSELLYSTYLGGNSEDVAYALAPDGAGGVVVAGYTVSDNFPTTENAYQRNGAGSSADAFITRLNASGNSVIYSTYLGEIGGNGNDFAYGLIPDGLGGVVVAGNTGSQNFLPLKGHTRGIISGILMSSYPD